MDIKKQIKVALGLEEEEVKLGFQAKTEDGTIVVSTADEIAVGVDMSVLTEDGTTILLPVGTYKLEDGTTVVIEEEGIVAEFTPGNDEEVTEETEEVEASEQEFKHTDDHKYADIEERMTKLEEAIDELKNELGKDKEEMSEEVVLEEVEEDKSDSPKTVTTKTTEVVEFNAEEEIEKLKAENEKLKTELSKSPAETPINTNKFSSEKVALSRKDYNKLSRQERFIYNLNK